MLGSLDSLFAATVCFVGGHFLLSASALRAPLIARLGEQTFRGVYSLIVAAAFVWMVLAYGAAPYVELWFPAPALGWVAVAAMPVALFLAVCGYSTPSPTMPSGMDAAAAGHDPTTGIFRITRHPFLWGALLWAAAHIVANGDLASLVLMGGIAVLSVGGMVHIDRKKEAALGADWGPVLMTTSVVPFAAIAAGRTTFDWPGIGWWRPLVTVALYVAFIWAHPLLLGVPAWPAP